MVVGMEPQKYNIQHWQGKTFEETYQFGRDIIDENDKVVDFEPTNLSGYTGRMQLRSSIDSDDIVIELTTENGRISIDDNSVTLFMSDADTAAIPSGSYKYDLELISVSGRVYGPLYGTIKIKGEVTR